MMHPLSLNQLPPPPPGRVGWPWTEATPPLPALMEDGRPWPKITLVTPSFRQVEYIEETLRSVLLQGYPNLEYIVVDGGSTDGTVEVLQRYAPFLDYWVSERDRGQSHALNKGFARANGELMNWINSDDLLMPGALAAVARAWHANPGTLIAGPVIRFVHDSGAETLYPQYGLSYEHIVQGWNRKCQFQQPGLFFPYDLFEQVGRIDETLRCSMDYDLFCRMLRHRTVTYVEQPLARFRYHSGSKTGSEEENFALEGYKVSQRYWGTWVTPRERLKARQRVAARLARSAVRWLASGNIRRSLTIYRRAAGFSVATALNEPFNMVALFLQRRRQV